MVPQMVWTDGTFASAVFGLSDIWLGQKIEEGKPHLSEQDR